MKHIVTYDTYDLLHYSHIELFHHAREMGGYLIVALSIDEFNQIKHKESYCDYEQRKMTLESIRYVGLVTPEKGQGQKEDDVKKFDVDVFVMGHGWEGEFDPLKDKCEVIYLERTEGISTAKIKQRLCGKDAK